MKRTTVHLSDDVRARLQAEAARRHTSLSAVARDAIDAHLAGSPRRLLDAAGVGRSGQSDLAERIEEILADEITPSR